MPTGSAGQPSTSATAPMDMDSGDEQQADETMGQSAQSISSSRTSTSMAETIIDLQSLMWGSVVSPQCAPMILHLLMTQTEY
eukprot:5139588-Amphidinium_carterae.1